MDFLSRKINDFEPFKQFTVSRRVDGGFAKIVAMAASSFLFRAQIRHKNANFGAISDGNVSMNGAEPVVRI